MRSIGQTNSKFHNPKARNPISPDAFAGITQYYFVDGDLHTRAPHQAVIASMTTILRLVGEEYEEEQAPKPTNFVRS